ncbi:MFS transporter [Nonomuraea diastatica]|uniref:MFS transporter n=1 Tax=Nonomuraea diastatica TaxID=1848329 RepID=A0A4R4WLA7_9ACTN|nr:MFS transporter [Nonomuraea diastatica]TDD17233.1 MFS transporter [Nonomuraea diastatica]
MPLPSDTTPCPQVTPLPCRTPRRGGRRRLALVTICLAQLMVVVDGTIVNVALPSLTADLMISTADRQWVVTAYMLAFGGLLLLGGRFADRFGRKRMLMVGLTGFAFASALGGAADSLEALLAARAGQGAFGALLAPTALSLLSTAFPDPGDRRRAFGIYGAVAGGGSALGLLLGGVLTQHLTWRWCMLINVPVAALALLCAAPLPREHRVKGGRPRVDIPGAILVTGGLVTIVYGFTRAEGDGWGAAGTLALLGTGVALLLLFVLIEKRVPSPLLPLRTIMHSTRAGANLSVLLAVAGMFAVFFFLNFYLQDVKAWSPMVTGAAFLPMTGAVLIASLLAGSRLPTRVPPRVVISLSALIAAIGMVLLSRLDVTSGYGHVLAALIAIGFGMGGVLTSAIDTATHGVDPRDAGVAGATVNAAFQVGGSLGTALLNTIAASATSDYLSTRVSSPARRIDALVHGYGVASWWGAGILAAAGLVALFLINVAGPATTRQAARVDTESHHA